MNVSTESPSALLRHYNESGIPYAIICKQGEDYADILHGPMQDLDHLSDIPRPAYKADDGFQYRTLSLVPYSQAQELGLDAIDDECKIRCMTIEEHTRVSLESLLGSIEHEDIVLSGDLEYSDTPDEYADIVRRVISEQIKEGKLCNCVVCTQATAEITDMSPQKALSIFKDILENEFGSYMTSFVFDGERYHITASPERQLTVEDGTVRMNPISGTFRKKDGKIDRDAFIDFLKNPKEVNELFMCTDEELKQMADMCSECGIIVGPLLKEMSKLVHTEFELVGKSDKDIIDLLRMSLHAPTVTGSPREAAHTAIANMESSSREYYAGSLVLTGYDKKGSEFLDSAIMIRSMNIFLDGLVSMRVGASIVRDSIPEEESRECRAKLAGIIAALLSESHEKPISQLPDLTDDEIRKILEERMIGMNRFLIESQENVDHTVEELVGKTITIIDNEDQFSSQLANMSKAMGANVKVISNRDYDPDLCTADIVIVGPGPGNPTDMNDPKIAKIHTITRSLSDADRTFMAVCLGHQILCDQLGYDLEKKAKPTQGVQVETDFFGQRELLGFYNTFTAKASSGKDDNDVSIDRESNEINAIRSGKRTGIQFHPESIFSENGFAILSNELRRLISMQSSFESTV